MPVDLEFARNFSFQTINKLNKVFLLVRMFLLRFL